METMNWPHLHLALNHVPVIGMVFLFILLLAGVLKRSEEIKRIALQGIFILSVLSIAIKFSGDFAAESLQNHPGIEKKFVQSHEETADQATAAVFVTGLAALVALVASRKGRSVPQWATILTLLFTLATFALMVRTAQSGGLIRHEEIRR